MKNSNHTCTEKYKIADIHSYIVYLRMYKSCNHKYNSLANENNM